MPDYVMPDCPKAPDSTVALHPCSIAELAAAITMSAEINAAGISYVKLCAPDGTEVVFEACKTQDSNVKYTGTDGSTFEGDLGTLLAAGYGMCQEKKVYVGERCFYPTDQDSLPPSKRDIIVYDAWVANGQFCYVPLGAQPTTDNIISEEIINTLTMSSEKLGALPIINSEIKTKKGSTLDICGGAAGRPVLIADLQATIDADIAALTAKAAPETGYEYGLIAIEAIQHPAKKAIHCDLTDADGIVSANDQIDYAFGTDTGQKITVGDSKDTIMKMLPDADACGCLDDRTCLIVEADFTTPITLPANTGVELCLVYACVIAEA